MKKIILTIMMVVWANGIFAQTYGDSIEVSAPIANELDYNKLAEAIQKQEEAKLKKPIQHYRKDKFSRRMHAVQRLGIAVVGGTDGDADDASTLKRDYKTEEDEREASEDDGQFNEGLSLDYTYGFVFGKTDENNLFTPNKFGFSLNTGLIFSFDKQNRYGTTFDLLFKFGLETGFNHPLGLAVDLLLGTGKSCGDFLYDITTDDGNTEDMEIPYTDWCFKTGFRISVRSNLLNTQLKNTDVRLFFQYVDSKNPYNDADLRENGIFNKWQEQSWSFGLLLVRYL